MKKRLFAFLAILFTATCVQASMIWVAVAVDPAQIEELSKNEKLLATTLFETTGDNDNELYLDKAWHIIHFLLNGTAWEVNSVAGQAVIGGKEFGPDMGYGPAHLLTAKQVKEIAEALETITPEHLSAKYDPKAMEKAEIYPSNIWLRDGQEALEYLLNYYQPLRLFYQRAAKNGQAVIIVIT